jgi:hypothetical protein
MNPYLPPSDVSGLPPYHAGPSDGRAGVTEMSVEMLRQTKPWVMVISVLMFLGAGFMLLASLLMMAGAAFSPSGSGVTAAVAVIYVPMAVLYIYPAVKLWKYGGAINRLVLNRDTSDLEGALEQQKSFWKFSGITALIFIILYIVIFVIAMAVGVMGAAMRH